MVEGGEDLVDDAGVDGLSIEGEVSATGGLGDLAEDLFIESSFDDVAIGVADPFALVVGIGVGDEAAGLRADADAEDDDVFVGGEFEEASEFGVGFAAVAEEDEAVIAGGRFFEGFEGEFDGATEFAAAAWDGEGVEALNGFRDGGVVGGEGGLEVGIASEGDEADAVASEEGEEVLGGEFGAGEAIGDEVVGEHGAGGVDRDDDVAAGFTLGLLFFAVLRACGGDDEEAEGEDLEEEGGPGAEGGDAGYELLAEAGGGEGGEGFAAAVVGEEFAEEEDGGGDEDPEPGGVGEGEGGGH